MIEIPQPAMVCNAENIADSFLPYKMWNTRTVTKDVPISWLIQNIVDVAKTAPGGILKSLVLNSHGAHGQIHLGKGIYESTAPRFAPLKGLVGDIFIVSCGVAGSGPSKYDRSLFLDGWPLCTELAKQSGAYVYAPKSNQSQSRRDRSSGIPYGYVDDVEGEAFVFLPDGSSRPWDKKAPVAR